MNHSAPPERMKLKQYDLEVLRSTPVFDYEPEDGIDSVVVSAVSFRSLNSNGQYTIQTNGRKCHESDVYDVAAKDDMTYLFNSPCFEIHHARLSVRYRPVLDETRTSNLTFDIRMPNRCNLRDKKRIEQTLNNRLPRHWGLLKEAQ